MDTSLRALPSEAISSITEKIASVQKALLAMTGYEAQE